MKKTFELDGSDDTLGTQVFEIAPLVRCWTHKAYPHDAWVFWTDSSEFLPPVARMTRTPAFTPSWRFLLKNLDP
jgi:hypothetical protein